MRAVAVIWLKYYCNMPFKQTNKQTNKSPQCFQKAPYSGSLKVSIVWYINKTWEYCVKSSRVNRQLVRKFVLPFPSHVMKPWTTVHHFLPIYDSLRDTYSIQSRSSMLRSDPCPTEKMVWTYHYKTKVFWHRKHQECFFLTTNRYWTKVKTLHIYSSSKTALILVFRNKIKSNKKILFFGFHLLENTCTAQVVTRP